MTSLLKPDIFSCVADLSLVLNLNPKNQHSATTANFPQKRKRTSVPRPSNLSVEHPEALNPVPNPPPSSAVDIPGLLNLVPRPQSTILPADLPVVSNVAPSPQPYTAPLHHDGPLKIHNRSVEEYQQIYHEVVDEMLWYVCVNNHNSFNQIIITLYFKTFHFIFLYVHCLITRMLMI